MDRRAIYVAVIVAIIVIGAAVYYFTMPAPEVKPTKIRIAIRQTIGAMASMKPAAAGTAVMSIVGMVHQPIIYFNPKMEMVPVLATSWTPYNETAWEFKFRKDVKFHCGHPFTVDDVINTYEVMLNPDFPTNKWAMGPIRRFEKVDDYTMRAAAVDVEGNPIPYSILPNYLAMVMNEIICKEDYEKYGFEDYGTAKEGGIACGTGPYKLKEFITGEKVVLEKWKDYWGPPQKGPDILEVLMVKDDSARIVALETGDVDWINMVPPVEMKRLRDKGFNVTSVPNNRVIFVSINVMKPPTDDVRIRQAMNYAVNVDEICEEIFYGGATRVDSVAHPTIPGYGGEPYRYKYNPEKAKALMEEAGYKGEEIVFIGMWGRFTMDKQIQETIADYLRAVGFNVKHECTEYGTMLHRIKKQGAEAERDGSKADYHLAFSGWASMTGENWYQLSSHFYSVNYVRYFEGYYFDDEMDTLFENALREFDMDKRNKILIDVQKKIIDEAAVIFLYGEPTIYAQSPRLTGVWYKPDEFYHFHNATITPKEAAGSVGALSLTGTLPLLGYSAFLLSEVASTEPKKPRRS